MPWTMIVENVAGWRTGREREEIEKEVKDRVVSRVKKDLDAL